MIEVANENIGRKVVVTNRQGHCFEPGTKGVITEVQDKHEKAWYIVEAEFRGRRIDQALYEEDFLFVGDDNADGEA